MCDICYGVMQLISGAFLISTGFVWASEALRILTTDRSPKVYIYRGYPDEDNSNPQAEVATVVREQKLQEL